MEREKYSEGTIASLFIIIPTVFIIIGVLLFPYPIKAEVKSLLPIPLFIGIILLGFGSFLFLKSCRWICFLKQPIIGKYSKVDKINNTIAIYIAGDWFFTDRPTKIRFAGFNCPTICTHIYSAAQIL